MPSLQLAELASNHWQHLKALFERLICLTVLDFGRMGCSSFLLGFEWTLLNFNPSQFLAHAGRHGEPKIFLLEQSPVAVREKNTCILPSCSICLRRLSLNCNWSRLLVSLCPCLQLLNQLFDRQEYG